MLNVVNLLGRLTADPVMRYTTNETPVCSFGIAVERDYSGKDGEKEVDFFNVTAWRNTGDFVKKYFVKGQPIVVHGRLSSRVYEDNTGNRRSVVEVVAQNCYFAGDKPKDKGAPGAPDLKPAAFQELADDDGEIPF